MASSLGDKTISGVAWNSIDRIAHYGISFVVSIVLARLLSPEDYGLIGIITIFITIFNAILDGGLSTALIRKKDLTDNDCNTVFYSNIVLSIFLSLTLFFSAPLIARFFERPELVDLVKVMSSILVINAFSIVQQSLLTKNINFKTQTIISVVANVSSGVVGIALAFAGFGVWALVAQQLSARLFTTILLWVLNKWLPKFVFSWDSFKELFGFGWKLLVTRVLSSLWGQLYQGIIGKCYSPATLGLYTRAVQYGQLFSTGVSDVVLKVSLPVMSSIQDDRERLLRGTRKIIKTTMFVTFLVMMIMAASAKSLIFVLIGEKWLPCVPMLQILCFNLVMNPLCYINENLLTVEGRSDKLLLLQVYKIVITIVPLLLGIFVDIYWMLVGSAVVSWIAIVLYTYYTNKYFGYSFKDQLKDIKHSILFSLGIAVPVYLISFIPISLYVVFALQISLACVLVLVCGKVLKIEEYQYVKETIGSLAQKFTKNKQNR